MSTRRPKPSIPTIAAALRAAVRKGGGPEAIARSAGVSSSAVYRGMRGQDLRADKLEAIAEACGVRAEELTTARRVPAGRIDSALAAWGLGPEAFDRQTGLGLWLERARTGDWILPRHLEVLSRSLLLTAADLLAPLAEGRFSGRGVAVGGSAPRFAVGDSRPREPFPSPWSGAARVPPPVERKASSPRYLRLPVEQFVGREQELGRAASAIGSGTEQLVAFVGPPGSGRSECTRVLAARLRTAFPRQICVKLASGARTGAAEAMMSFVAQLQSEVLPASDAASSQDLSLQQTFRSIMRRQRVLLVVEGVADESQIESLVPPAGSKGLVVVTAIAYSGGPRQRVEPLGPLSMADAKALLVRLCPGLTGTQARRIAAASGRLPGQLWEAAVARQAALHARPDAPHLMRGSDSRKARLRCPPGLHWRWAYLSVLAGSIEASAAAAIWAVPQERATSILGRLVRHGLIAAEREGSGMPSGRRYYLHAAQREQAAQALGRNPGCLASASRRHARWYQDVLASIDESWRRGGVVGSNGLWTRWLSALPDLEIGRAWIDQDPDWNEALRHGLQPYCVIGRWVLPFLLRAEGIERWASGDLAVAERAARADWRGTVHRLLGVAAGMRRCWTDARAHIDRACEILDVEGHEAEFAEALGARADHFIRRQQYEEALRDGGRALALAEQSGNEACIGPALTVVGTAEYRRMDGDPAAAIRHLEKGLLRAELQGSLSGLVAGYGNLGHACRALASRDESQAGALLARARESYRAQARLAIRLRQRPALGNSLLGLSHCLRLGGQQREGLEKARRALRIFRAVGLPVGEAQALGHVQDALWGLGERDRASRLCVRIVELFDRHGYTPPGMDEVRRRAALAGVAALATAD